MHVNILLFVVSSNVLGCFSVQRQSLGGLWNLDEANGAYTALKANVPGGIFTDLQFNKVIEDPIYEENDQKTKWVGRTNWTYYRNFTVDKELLEFSDISVVFEGLDTVSTIFLNGKQIGNSNNMFVRYIFNIKNYLLVGSNSIEVKFLSPVKVAEDIALEQSKSYSVPPECPPSNYRGECHINELRKMQASFSWDWGPALASVGIWKDVYLEASNNFVIRYVVVEIEEKPVESIWNVSVKTYLSSNTFSHANGKLSLQLDTDYETKLTIVTTVNASTNGFNEVEVSQTLAVPQNSLRRWWPNGYGEQCLYNITVSYFSNDSFEQYTQKIGFRTVELVQDELKTSQGVTGNTFYFKVNGIPIFAKGSNAIPLSILPEKGQDRKSIDNLLKTARDCNMNMLRVWGGGVYESDYYYQKADELGIMIWQDFMFACALYPSRKEFLSNVISEVRHQVRRIGSHPSIVLWAGNNENEAAITGNWYGSNGKQIYNDDYKKLYFETIKPEFERLLKRGTFIGSSPTNGIKSEEEGGISKNPYDLRYGDDHTYIYEFDSFDPNIYPTPRFSSEYGFQSYPSISALEKTTANASNIKIGSDFLKHRQHHPLGDIELRLLIFYQLSLPDNQSYNYTDVFVFYTQVVQAVAIKTETEHYRKYRSITTEDGKGLTMGALYWQLNDVWIAPTWSGVDVNGKWKMLQYFVRNAFAPIVTIGHLTSDRKLEITVVSDETRTVEDATLTIVVYNWSSFIPVNVTVQNITIERGSSKNVLTIYTDDFLQQIGCGSLVEAKRNCFFHLNLSKSNTSIAPENFVLPDKLKKLNLKKPKIQDMIRSEEDNSEVIAVAIVTNRHKVGKIESVVKVGDKNFRIVVNTSEITLFVWLDCQGIPGRYSENGFHQISRTKVVYFESEIDTSADIVRKNLFVSNILSVNKF